MSAGGGASEKPDDEELMKLPSILPLAADQATQTSRARRVSSAVWRRRRPSS